MRHLLRNIFVTMMVIGEIWIAISLLWLTGITIYLTFNPQIIQILHFLHIIKPAQPLSLQLSIFTPKKISLPDGLRPETIEAANEYSQFIVYATTSDGSEQKNKRILLIDINGRILDQQEINIQCHTPFSIARVGIIAPNCYVNKSVVYAIRPDKIEPGQTIDSTKYEKFSRDGLKLNGINLYRKRNNLSDEIIYTQLCKSGEYSSCLFIDAKLSIRGQTANIKDYFLRDYIILYNNKVAMIFQSDTGKIDNTKNELYIID